MSLARCARCECLYSEGESGERACRYHPGQWRNWWSCCKDPLQASTGCRAAQHVQDVAATAMLEALSLLPAPRQPSSMGYIAEDCTPQHAVVVFEQPGGTLQAGEEVFDRVDESASLAAVPSPYESSALEEATVQPTDMSVGDGRAVEEGRDATLRSEGSAGGNDAQTTTVPYFVRVHDTFASISMRHKMSESELANLNQLKRYSVRPGDVLMVYDQRSDVPSEDTLRRQVININSSWEPPS